MAAQNLSHEQLAEIDRVVEYYSVEYHSKRVSALSRFREQVRPLLEEKLGGLVHSTKAREKDPEHLRQKLIRKTLEAQSEGATFEVTESNLLQTINDLVGIRILHLHTHQMAQIHPLILSAFEEANLPLVESPFARTWDDESRGFFKKIGLQTQDSPSLYTSVHYVVQSNSKVIVTAEVQVRTLAEELWGEVDHAINYPEKCLIESCREQIKVLARVTSSCTRLVDSIFDAYVRGKKGGLPT